MSEFATLLRASPMKASFRPSIRGKLSSTVSMSASIWVGWKSSVSPFHTGTPALAASSSTVLWENPRYSMPSYIRPRTWAVSAMDSFAPIWQLPGSRQVTPMPRSMAATSKAQRVRVEVFSNRSTTFLP